MGKQEKEMMLSQIADIIQLENILSSDIKRFNKNTQAIMQEASRKFEAEVQYIRTLIGELEETFSKFEGVSVTDKESK